MTLPTPTTLRRTAIAAAMVVAGGLFAAGSAQAAPFAPPRADAIAADSGVSAVHWHGRRHHHHHGWGYGWRPRHHHHHHRGWGWGGHRHHHHHHRRHHHW